MAVRRKSARRQMHSSILSSSLGLPMSRLLIMTIALSPGGGWWWWTWSPPTVSSSRSSRPFVAGFASYLLSRSNCWTELAIDEVIMNHPVVSAELSDDPSMRLQLVSPSSAVLLHPAGPSSSSSSSSSSTLSGANAGSQDATTLQTKMMVPMDTYPTTITVQLVSVGEEDTIENNTTHPMARQQRSPPEHKDYQFVMDLSYEVNGEEAGQVHAGKDEDLHPQPLVYFDHGACEGQKRTAGRGRELISILVTSATVTKISLWAGWACNHEAVRLTPVLQLFPGPTAVEGAPQGEKGLESKSNNGTLAIDNDNHLAIAENVVNATDHADDANIDTNSTTTTRTTMTSHRHSKKLPFLVEETSRQAKSNTSTTINTVTNDNDTTTKDINLKDSIGELKEGSQPQPRGEATAIRFDELLTSPSGCQTLSLSMDTEAMSQEGHLQASLPFPINPHVVAKLYIKSRLTPHSFIIAAQSVTSNADASIVTASDENEGRLQWDTMVLQVGDGAHFIDSTCNGKRTVIRSQSKVDGEIQWPTVILDHQQHIISEQEQPQQLQYGSKLPPVVNVWALYSQNGTLYRTEPFQWQAHRDPLSALTNMELLKGDPIDARQGPGQIQEEERQDSAERSSKISPPRIPPRSGHDETLKIAASALERERILSDNIEKKNPGLAEDPQRLVDQKAQHLTNLHETLREQIQQVHAKTIDAVKKTNLGEMIKPEIAKNKPSLGKVEEGGEGDKRGLIDRLKQQHEEIQRPILQTKERNRGIHKENGLHYDSHRKRTITTHGNDYIDRHAFGHATHGSYIVGLVILIFGNVVVVQILLTVSKKKKGRRDL